MLAQAGGVKRILDEWEPQEFKSMIDGSAPLLFTEEVLESEETLATANAKVRTTVDELVSQWDSPPSPEMRCALLVLVLYIEADHAWCGTDDIASTRIIDLVFSDGRIVTGSFSIRAGSSLISRNSHTRWCASCARF